jgi:hypothetical protein
VVHVAWYNLVAAAFTAVDAEAPDGCDRGFGPRVRVPADAVLDDPVGRGVRRRRARWDGPAGRHQRGGVRGWLPWTVWLLALTACPVAMCAVVARSLLAGPDGSLSWTICVVEGLGHAHLAVSVVAWILVVLLARGEGRWLALAAILTVGIWTWVVVGPCAAIWSLVGSF